MLAPCPYVPLGFLYRVLPPFFLQVGVLLFCPGQSQIPG